MELSQYTPKTVTEYTANMISYLVSQGSDLSDFREGSRIRTLIEALALELSTRDYRHSSSFKNLIRFSAYSLFSFDLQPGKYATGVIRFEHTGHTADFPIPQFTISSLGYSFTSPGNLEIPLGQTYIDISMVADSPGAEYNIEALDIDTDEGRGDLDIDIEFDRIYNSVAFTGGTDGETEEERELRFQDFIQSLSKSTKKGIESGVRSVSGVSSFYVVENVNPYTLTTETGWINIYISPPTTELKAEVQNVIEGVDGDENYPGYKAAGVKLFVGDVTTVLIDITYSIEVLTSSLLEDSDFETIIQNELAQFVGAKNAGEDILLDQLKAVILRAHPEVYSVTITAPATDTVINNVDIAQLNTVTLSGVTRVNHD